VKENVKVQKKKEKIAYKLRWLRKRLKLRERKVKGSSTLCKRKK